MFHGEADRSDPSVDGEDKHGEADRSEHCEDKHGEADRSEHCEDKKCSTSTEVIPYNDVFKCSNVQKSPSLKFYFFVQIVSYKNQRNIADSLEHLNI